MDLGLPFAPTAVNPQWSAWPPLPDLFPASFAGAKTNRDSFLVNIDLHRLRVQIADYFNVELSHDEIASKYPVIMNTARHFDARLTRDTLLKRGGPTETGFINFAFRPFDIRSLYWEADTKLLNDKRADYRYQVFDGNMSLVTQQKPRREWSPPQVISSLGCHDLIDRGATCFPMWLRDEQAEGQQGMLDGGGEGRRPNLSAAAQRYVDRLGLGVEDLFHHALAVLHDPAYQEANAGALRMEWPRIPLPGWPDGDAPGAADELRASASRGRELAALLDPETPVAGVTAGALRPELAAIAIPSTAGGRNMSGDDFAVTAGWGHFGTGSAPFARAQLMTSAIEYIVNQAKAACG